MKRIAFYGGSFDPLHRGHLTIAEKLTEFFELDEFVFIPAFHAPHKKRRKPTSAFHRFAMLCLATNDDEKIRISTMELEVPEKPYTIETLTKLKSELKDTEIFFVMGADSWEEITTWRDWENVLISVNIIVVTRPNYQIGLNHVTEKVRERIIDTREISDKEKGGNPTVMEGAESQRADNREKDPKDKGQRIKNKRNQQFEIGNPQSIYITDAVKMDISATWIRQQIRENKNDWQEQVPEEVAKYIKKYDIY
jgi:nicotinate-nucleotide adenylyltransferase